MDFDLTDEPAADPLAINDFTIEEFTCGFCSELALALHARTGWNFRIETSRDDSTDLHHAWVVNEDGLAVDIRGVHDSGHARTHASKNERDNAVRDATLEEVLSYGVNDEALRWANALLDRNADHFGLGRRALERML